MVKVKVLRGTKTTKVSYTAAPKQSHSEAVRYARELREERAQRKDYSRRPGPHGPYLQSLLALPEREYYKGDTLSNKELLELEESPHLLPHYRKLSGYRKAGLGHEARKIQRFFKNTKKAKETQPWVNAHQLNDLINDTELFHLPTDVKKHVAKEWISGNGVKKPHQIKGSPEAKAYMARLRAMRHIYR